MVTVDKLQRGIARYIEEQVLPAMKGADRWIITSAATMALAKLPGIVQNNSALKMLGVIGADGTVDIENLIQSVRPAARATPMTINIPFTNGKITLTEQDLDNIARYIEQA